MSKAYHASGASTGRYLQRLERPPRISVMRDWTRVLSAIRVVYFFPVPGVFAGGAAPIALWTRFGSVTAR